MSDLLAFPHPVNEKAARSVAAGVVLLAAITLVTQWWWLTVPLALGFWARVLTGPTLSPLGQLATRVLAPRHGTLRLGPAEALRPGHGRDDDDARRRPRAHRSPHGGRGPARPGRRRRRARVGARVLRRLQDLRAAHAHRRDPERRLRRVRGH